MRATTIHAQGGLSDETLLRYRNQGFLLPLRAIAATEARALANRLQTLDRTALAQLNLPWAQKSYLLFTWLDNLVRRPRILDAVAAIVGPDVLVLSADLFIKEPFSPGVVSWHQDANYWHLEPMEVLTAWVALTQTTHANGCMRYSPRTQLFERLPHTETFGASNLLTRGQEIAVDIDESTAVPVLLKPGQMSLHHGLLAHASGANQTARPRIGIAIRYMSAATRQVAGPPITAMLVRGRDHGNFELETPPLADLDPDAITAHRRALEAHAAEHFSTV